VKKGEIIEFEDGSLAHVHEPTEELLKADAGAYAAAGGPLRHLLAYYRKKPHPFRACVADNRKRFGARVEQVCAALKDVALGREDWRVGRKGVAKADDSEIESWVREQEKKWRSRGLTEADAYAVLPYVRQQRKDYEATLKKGFVERLAKKVGLGEEDADDLADVLGFDDPLTTSPDPEDEPSEDMGLSPEDLQAVTKAASDAAKEAATEAVKPLEEKVESLSKSQEEKPSLEDLHAKEAEHLEALQGVRSDIAKLAEGGTSQTEDPQRGREGLTKEQREAQLDAELV
jgi:hypothetical protein